MYNIDHPKRLLALASVGLGCIYLVWNLTTLAAETAQPDIVARESARAILSDKYAIGMRRPDFDLNSSKLKARALADQLLKGFRMSPTETFDAVPDSITVDGAKMEAITVRFTAAASPATPAHSLFGNNVIAKTVELTGSGIANHSADSIANGLEYVQHRQSKKIARLFPPHLQCRTAERQCSSGRPII